jgi:hypothetical protein
MNERIRELAEQFNASFGERLEYAVVFGEMEDFEKFVDSIVRECIEQAHKVSNLRGITDDMIYGADTAAVVISKYFGVK